MEDFKNYFLKPSGESCEKSQLRSSAFPLEIGRGPGNDDMRSCSLSAEGFFRPTFFYQKEDEN